MIYAHSNARLKVFANAFSPFNGWHLIKIPYKRTMVPLYCTMNFKWKAGCSQRKSTEILIVYILVVLHLLKLDCKCKMNGTEGVSARSEARESRLGEMTWYSLMVINDRCSLTMRGSNMGFSDPCRIRIIAPMILSVPKCAHIIIQECWEPRELHFPQFQACLGSIANA